MTKASTGLRAALRKSVAHLFARGSAAGRGRLVLQVLGIVISLGLLGWCVSLALRPENREKIEALRHASPSLLALLLALSLVSLVFNGAGFWLTLRPVRRLGFLDMQAANAVASFLGYFPFKLSIVARVVIHSRRDGVPVLTIGAWLAANAAVVLAVLGPLTGAGLWRGRVDGAYFAAAAGGLVLTFVCLHAAARVFAHEAGLARLHRIVAAVRLRPLERLVRTPAFAHLHAGFAMLAVPGTLAGAMACRLADVLTQSARFVVASQAMGTSLPWDRAVILAGSYFLVGVLSPAGAVGSREGGATGLAALLPAIDHRAFAVVTLAVSGTEMIVTTAAMLAGGVYLKASAPSPAPPGPAAR